MITPLDGEINTKLDKNTYLFTLLSGLDPTKHEFPMYKLKPRIHHRKITPQL